MREIYISLTGGLGNQLFQLAASLFYAENGPVYIITSTGNPRKSNGYKSELEQLKLPSNVYFLHLRTNWFISRLIGYSLRSGVSPNKIENTKLFRIILETLSTLVISIYFKKYIKFQISNDVGFDSNLKLHKRSFLVGYFQSYKWLEEHEVKSAMSAMLPLDINEEFQNYSNEICASNSLIVHVRRGDYELENTFGLLDFSYYHERIRFQMYENNYDRILLFSDSNISIDHFVPDEFAHMAQRVTNFQNSSILTFQLMRLGNGYVIANSTFSWWAAVLSLKNTDKIMVPNPWFKMKSNPTALIPINWIKADSIWEKRDPEIKF